MNADMNAAAELSDRELVLRFESLGDNCKLGLVQRKVGAEPLGMFRFAGAPLEHLLQAMRARFAGMADPAHVQVQPENGEFMIRLLSTYQLQQRSRVAGGAEVFGAGWRCAVGRA